MRWTFRALARTASRVSLLVLALQLVPSSAPAQNVPSTHYDSAFLAHGVAPSQLSGVDWFPDDYEVQGVTNDGRNWFFTIVDQDKTHGVLWRIPKDVPLGQNVLGNSGVISIRSTEVQDLNDGKHWHWGDPDHVSIDGEDYVIVPIYDGDHPEVGATVACFRAYDLAYVNFTNLDDKVAPGWCAIGIDNKLYTSASSATAITSYHVDWARLLHTGFHDAASYAASIPLSQADGSPLYMTDMQGGEFTPDGEMLYLVSGRGYCFWNGAPWSPRDGVHAIETEGWREVARSTKTDDTSVPFRYSYDPSCITCFLGIGGAGTDTPEGITIWNLDDGSAPSVRGTVHVLVDRYMTSYACSDELYLHHFSPAIIVDGRVPESEPVQFGTYDHPFRTVAQALSHYPIWDGAIIRIVPRAYDERVTISKRIRLEVSAGRGPAVIGRGQ